MFYCRWCGFSFKSKIDKKTNSCSFCNHRLRMKDHFKRTVIKVKERKFKKPYFLRKLNKLQYNHIVNLVDKIIDVDLFDLNSELDSTLTYDENRNLILEDLGKKGILTVDKRIDLGLFDFNTDFERFNEV